MMTKRGEGARTGKYIYLAVAGEHENGEAKPRVVEKVEVEKKKERRQWQGAHLPV